MTNPLVKKGTPTFPKNDKIPKTDKGVKPEPVNNGFDDIYVPPVKVKNKQVSIYLDTDVIEALNSFGAEHGKGAKSELVNNFLKKYFNIRQGE
jgi:uncharacterized protein (DUF4415 family)